MVSPADLSTGVAFSTGRGKGVGAWERVYDDGVMAIDIPDECAALIALQRGVIGRGQAIDHKLPSTSIGTLLRTKRWQPLHRGVYAAFTGPPSRTALCWSALIRAGPEAILSHQTAAELYGLADPRGPSDAPIHVTVPRNRNPTLIKGVVVHRVVRTSIWRQ